jgi:hypothetical protein
VCSHYFRKKSQFTALCSQRVFQSGLLQDFPGTFEKWTFIFVHFYRAMPFLFWTFIKSDRVGILKRSQWGLRPRTTNHYLFKTSANP